VKTNTLSLRETAGLLRTGDISVRDVVEDLKAAIDQDNASPAPLNAYLRFDPDEILEQVSGHERAGTALCGAPVAVKDNINVQNTFTTCGSRILETYRSPYSATAVDRLNAAGGTPAGKMNMDEFGMGNSNENSAFGPVLNPHDRGKIPGGSSGGAAAAVASGLAIAALGSDTGGSIRQPAALCGVFGLKPTYGRVSRYGLVAYASSMDQIGPVTKNASDAALLMEVIAGHDPLDSTSADEPVTPYLAVLDKGVGGLKIGVPEEYFGEGLHPEGKTVVEQGIRMLEEAGAEVKRIHLEYTRYAIATYYILVTAEASSNLARFDGIRYGQRFSDTNDLLELYRENRNQGFGREVKRRIMLGTFALSSGYYDAYYLQAQKARTLILQDFTQAFKGVDLIVTPVTPRPAWNVGELMDDPLEMYLADAYTVPVSLAGLPAASVPCGRTTQGLPVGMQIAAPHFEEARIFRAARVIEEGSDA
jgi:aspartyl-tRNA(Asn)/glutamyl-tRNA(Gln) amidotransferase subunit A